MSYSGISNSIALAATLTMNAWQAFRNRRQILRLENLTDDQLKDIGLNRADVRWVRQVFWTQDVTAILTELARAETMETLVQRRRAVPASSGSVGSSRMKTFPSYESGPIAA